MSQIPFLLILILLPLCGILFAVCSQDNDRTKGRNVLSVALLTVFANVAFLITAFLNVSSEYGNMQLVETYLWLESPKIMLSFGVDSFSLLLMLGVHLALLIGLWGVRKDYWLQKSRIIFTLLFLSLINGFFAALDIISFFIFFEAMLIPLFMLIGMFGEIKKQAGLFRFMLYNLCGVLLLFAAVMVLYNHNGGSLMLNQISAVKMSHVKEITVWSSIFLAFLSRIPIWPFHSWVSAVSSGIKNPLVFIVANLMPLSGIYSFIRFWPKTVPGVLSYFMIILEIICVISMLFIALIGLINKDFQYKIFSFMTVWYIIYLLAAFLPTDTVLQNIGYALFSFLIIAGGMEVLSNHMEKQQESLDISSGGILCAMPKAARIFTFFVLAAVGMPLSSMFLNNFVLVANLMDKNLQMGFLVIFAMLVVAAGLLQELYRLRDTECSLPDKSGVADISYKAYVILLMVCASLVLTFINPLWFVV